MKKRILITGAAGYIGNKLIHKLAEENTEAIELVAGIDIKPPQEQMPHEKFEFHQCDIRSDILDTLIKEKRINTIVHLASVVTPTKTMTRELMYEIDVVGTKKLYESAIKHRVSQFVVTSSGAAYGYHHDNPEWLYEGDALRGNKEFAYSDHKRLIEEMLSTYRKTNKLPQQLILRPGTILGKNVSNQITALFEKKAIIGIQNATTPFVFIWDEDVVNIILQGIKENKSGVFNLAGNGYVTLKEIANILKKPYVAIPAWVIKSVLWLLHKVKLTQYGPEQVRFLRYRPVLANDTLKKEFPYTPTYTSKEVFEYYLNTKS
ncbi:SDR family oxidoreductase [Leptobacterium sp. I13]|uniref:SDR family oxidoreductase n=1 Tax=Leptobacterium meishanense TaxID=3128904 RepID=UPI0030EB205A